jgi:hypothetical protein
MSALAFFPWLRLDELIEVGGFQLLPYERHERPAGPRTPTQDALDAVLAAYREHRGSPVEHATLLRHPEHGITDDLAVEERAELFAFAELLAFCGLARRQFFGSGMFYANRDDYALVIQNFVDPRDGVGITTRRRDGVMNSFLTAGLYELRRPLHGSPNPRIRIEVELLRALLQAQGAANWTRRYDSILAFNRSNTDSDQVVEEAEVVLGVAAFQRLLDCRTTNVGDLAHAFAVQFEPRHAVPLPDPMRPGCQTDRRPVREVWMRSFYAVRGPVAHARSADAVPSPWTLREHLLLCAYAFPLLVKLNLAASGEYSLTDSDRFDVDVFELLAGTPDLLGDPARSPDGMATWDRVRNGAPMQWWSRRGEAR